MKRAMRYMHSGRWFQRGTAVILIVAMWGTAVQFAHADPFAYSEDFNKFGDQANFACGGGACGAVSTVNSFIFLENQYPDIYGNKLTPNYDPLTNTDRTDANAFGFAGWKVDGDPQRQGYYNRPTSDAGQTTFLNTLKEWVGDYAPGTTTVSSWFLGSPDNNRTPTIDDLAQEIKDQENVEFFVRSADKNFYHVLTLTGVSRDMAGNLSITYQDPNDPTVNQMAAVTVNGGMLQFTGVPGSNYNGTVTITAAFSESPVPEPSTLTLLGLGAFGLLGYGWRHRKRAIAATF